MSLQPRHRLQLVLNVAQKQIGRDQLPRFAGLEVPVEVEALERRNGARLAQARIPATINQGQRLHHELELTDAAAAKLDIALDQVRRLQLVFDLSLHLPQLPQRVEVEILSVDK